MFCCCCCWWLFWFCSFFIFYWFSLLFVLRKNPVACLCAWNFTNLRLKIFLCKYYTTINTKGDVTDEERTWSNSNSYTSTWPCPKGNQQVFECWESDIGKRTPVTKSAVISCHLAQCDWLRFLFTYPSGQTGVPRHEHTIVLLGIW